MSIHRRTAMAERTSCLVVGHHPVAPAPSALRNSMPDAEGPEQAPTPTLINSCRRRSLRNAPTSNGCLWRVRAGAASRTLGCSRHRRRSRRHIRRTGTHRSEAHAHGHGGGVHHRRPMPGPCPGRRAAGSGPATAVAATWTAPCPPPGPPPYPPPGPPRPTSVTMLPAVGACTFPAGKASAVRTVATRGKQRAHGESRHHHSFHTCVSSSFGHRGRRRRTTAQRGGRAESVNRM